MRSVPAGGVHEPRAPAGGVVPAAEGGVGKTSVVDAGGNGGGRGANAGNGKEADGVACLKAGGGAVFHRDAGLCTVVQRGEGGDGRADDEGGGGTGIVVAGHEVCVFATAAEQQCRKHP